METPLKPSDFYIGVIDFFSVMLPGAVFTYFLEGSFYGDIFGVGKVFPEPDSEPAKWLVFLTSAYILGNLIFMVASLLDLSYNRIFRKLVFQTRHDLSYRMAHSIQNQHLNIEFKLRGLLASRIMPENEYILVRNSPKQQEIFNTFKWSQHFLLFDNPRALAEIERTVADSKFFRSLVVTFLALGGMLLYRETIIPGTVCLALAALSYYRYGELRFKSTEKAYEMIITRHHLQPSADNGDARDAEIGYQDIKSEITSDFAARYSDKLAFLSHGTKSGIKQISVESEMPSPIKADRAAELYCLLGTGVLKRISNSGVESTKILPNAIIPIARGEVFSILRSSTEPIDLVVLEK